ANLDWVPLGATLRSGDQFSIHVQRLMDAPAEPFLIFHSMSIAAGRYWWTRGELQYDVSPARAVSVSALFGWGGFYDGRDTQEDLSATWRNGGHLILGANLSRSEVSLSTGRFTALQAGTRMEYAFSTRADLLAFVQFDNESERADFDLRFHWTPVNGDDVFVVWNSGYTTDPGARFSFPDGQSLSRQLNGALIVKAVHRLSP